MKKNLLMVVLLVLSVFLIAGCSSRGTTKEANKTPLTADEIKQMYSDPDAFKGRYVELGGRIFANVEKSNDGVYFQMWQNPTDSSGNTLVSIADTSLDVAANDFVIVKGIVKGKYEGQNAFGGNMLATAISADSVDVSDYQTAIAPAIKTIEVNQTIDQGGCILTLQKVEFSDIDTRFYLKAINNASDKFSIWGYSPKVIQAGKQFDSDSMNSYMKNYPQFSGDIMQGANVEGIIAFPKMEQSDLQLVVEGYCYDYTNKLSPYTYNVIAQ